MKTNQVMTLDFDGKSLEIEHKTKMGSLTELWAIGNSIREAKGLNPLLMSHYLRSPETLELVQALERKYGLESKTAESAQLENGRVATIESELIRTKRGRHGGGTWAHIYLLLDAASRMDADFKVKMFDILIEGKLLEWRDDSGDSFKALNMMIEQELVKDAANSKHYYIRVAIAVKENVSPTGGSWNTATYQELKRRDTIENQLMTMLKMKLIRDINHMVLIAKTM
jgi:hypothetical protein